MFDVAHFDCSFLACQQCLLFRNENFCSFANLKEFFEEREHLLCKVTEIDDVKTDFVQCVAATFSNESFETPRMQELVAS